MKENRHFVQINWDRLRGNEKALLRVVEDRVNFSRGRVEGLDHDDDKHIRDMLNEDHELNMSMLAHAYELIAKRIQHEIGAEEAEKARLERVALAKEHGLMIVSAVPVVGPGVSLHEHGEIWRTRGDLL